MVLPVRVWVSLVPTMVPDGAVTVDSTPEVNNAIPEPVALFITLPVVLLNNAISLSTEEAGPVTSPPPPPPVAVIVNSSLTSSTPIVILVP